MLRYALRSGTAVADPAVLDRELLDGYIATNLADAHRRAKTRRFLAGRLDRANQRATGDALPGLRAFDHPTLIVWGQDDRHFGPHRGQRLREDIPAAHHLELLPGTGHATRRPTSTSSMYAAYAGSASSSGARPASRMVTRPPSGEE